MNTKRICRGLLALGMAAVMLLSPVLSVSAAEIPGETEGILETTAALATEAPTLPPETTAPSAPPETTAPPATTVPPETAAPPVTMAPPETTVPPETQTPTETTVPPETTMPPAATLPTETAPAEETEPVETMEAAATIPAAQTVTIYTVAQAGAMAAGTENITVRGTVVYAANTLAVLQDDTGGMRLFFPDAPDIALGDVLQVTGRRSGGFTVTAYEKQGTEQMPAVECTLLEAPDNVRVLIQDAVLGRETITQNGFTMNLAATLPESAASVERVDAYGVLLDGWFYADSILPRSDSETEETQSWNAYFGQLHAHTGISDGKGTVAEAFSHAAGVEGLDFFAVTDHSNSFDNAAFGAIDANGLSISNEWAEGKAAAAAVTDETFVGIFGYEMTWREDLALGHINTFNTPGWQTRDQKGFETLTAYYDALTTVPGSISQFNHPGHEFGAFQSFGNYSPAYDEVIHLLEVGGSLPESYYTKALDQGWHVAPANNQNNHEENWGDASAVRTVILAQELTEQSLYEAIRSCRVYATEDSDLEIFYRLNGHIMGSILGPTEQPVITAELHDPTDSAMGTVEVVADGGEIVASQTVTEPAASLTIPVPVGHSYYYLQITQLDGDTAVTAPIWIDNYEAMGIAGFTADTLQPEQEQEVELTLELFNQEKVDFVLEKMEFSQNGQVLHAVSDPGTVRALSGLTYRFPASWSEAGGAEILAAVTGTVAGQQRTYEKWLTLHVQAKEIIVSDIAQARHGIPGETFRVTGYVTAGNEKAGNSFPDTIYLQDDTGGIAVVGVQSSGIGIGAPMEITGVLREQGGNLVLERTDERLLGGTYYRYTPRTMTHAVAMDYAVHGGELLQIEGTVVSLTPTPDGKGIARLTLRDVRGDLATVMIEENIRSGSQGTNTLASQIKKGRTVRALGLLHMEEDGAVVLRVRNCEEVVYVPPKADPTNPKTGDWLYFWK